MAPTDADLLELLRTGTDAQAKQAWGLLCNRRHRRTYHYFLKLVHNPADADDLTQRFFIRIGSIRRREVNVADAERYFGTMAKNLVSDFFRETGNRIDTVDLDEATLPDSPQTIPQSRVLAQLAFEQLAIDDQEILVLREYCRLKPIEILAVLRLDGEQLNEGTINTRRSRAWQRWKEKAKVLLNATALEIGLVERAASFSDRRAIDRYVEGGLPETDKRLLFLRILENDAVRERLALRVIEGYREKQRAVIGASLQNSYEQCRALGPRSASDMERVVRRGRIGWVPSGATRVRWQIWRTVLMGLFGLATLFTVLSPHIAASIVSGVGSVVGLVASTSERTLLVEDFESRSLDSRVSFASAVDSIAPGVRPLAPFGIGHGFAFGRSKCPSNCFDVLSTNLTITFPDTIWIASISFKVMELDGNWGSVGYLYLDGRDILPAGQGWGRLPENDGISDDSFRIRRYAINKRVKRIQLHASDITSQSELLIDDLMITGR